MLGSAFLPPKPSLCRSSPSHLSPGFESPIRAFVVTASAATISPDPVKAKSSRNTLYEILCVDQTASQAEIKAAYRSLAKLHHPDITPSDRDGQDFIDIHNAYATLSDPAARASYDLSIRASAPCYRFRYSTSNTFQGHRPTRRWETDQCW
ncbi:PREDICTED: chaperone protein dnaJ 11, chloroplastic-like [Populus euphratica]|uniref:Chaperone protein dnaJ 11, chloroplastic-like n=1 Tax=Populus euphratica TaxID=75702 RepID=A0AAJ6X4U1_POPEU|nr:PREDICTED: chaperone protein dnaJ 11, chloroplastic-like [Populus euphratica]